MRPVLPLRSERADAALLGLIVAAGGPDAATRSRGPSATATVTARGVSHFHGLALSTQLMFFTVARCQNPAA